MFEDPDDNWHLPKNQDEQDKSPDSVPGYNGTPPSYSDYTDKPTPSAPSSTYMHHGVFPEDTRVMTVKDWLLMQLVMMIPCVNGVSTRARVQVSQT